MLPELLPVFAQGGVTAVILWIGYKLHVDAVRTHDKRAEEWRLAYEREAARSAVRDEQLAHVLGAVKQTAGQS